MGSPKLCTRSVTLAAKIQNSWHVFSFQLRFKSFWENWMGYQNGLSDVTCLTTKTNGWKTILTAKKAAYRYINLSVFNRVWLWATTFLQDHLYTELWKGFTNQFTSYTLNKAHGQLRHASCQCTWSNLVKNSCHVSEEEKLIQFLIVNINIQLNIWSSVFVAENSKQWHVRSMEKNIVTSVCMHCTDWAFFWCVWVENEFWGWYCYQKLLNIFSFWLLKSQIICSTW